MQNTVSVSSIDPHMLPSPSQHISEGSEGGIDPVGAVIWLALMVSIIVTGMLLSARGK